jgi:hypothetical protein
VASRSAVCQAGLRHGRGCVCRAPGQPGTRQTCWPRGKAAWTHGRLLATGEGKWGTRQTICTRQRCQQTHGKPSARQTSESRALQPFGFPPERWRQNTAVNTWVCRVYSHGNPISYAIFTPFCEQYVPRKFQSNDLLFSF